jgi:outer membrane lipoprotein carrier protein
VSSVGRSDRRTVGLFLIVVAFLSNAPTVRQSDALAILDHASATYDTVRTLSADFVQIVDNPMAGVVDTTRGRLYQEKPNRFAMRFTAPKGDRIVADGRWLWLYTPSTTPGQVIRTAIPSAGTTGPNLIAQFVERPRERYAARWLRADSLASGAGLADVLALTPKDASVPYREAAVWVCRGSGLLARIEISETSGQRRVVVLRNLGVNTRVPAREFTFAPPAGARVVNQ